MVPYTWNAPLCMLLQHARLLDEVEHAMLTRKLATGTWTQSSLWHGNLDKLRRVAHGSGYLRDEGGRQVQQTWKRGERGEANGASY